VGIDRVVLVVDLEVQEDQGEGFQGFGKLSLGRW